MTSVESQQGQPQSSTAASNKTAGGIGWAGSLVGSQNPNNLGYRYSTPYKRFKRAGSGKDGEDQDGGQELPANIVVRFQNRQGEDLVAPMDLPTQSSVDDLNALLHSLLDQDGDDDDHSRRIPYAFYAKVMTTSSNNVTTEEDKEVTTSLVDLIRQCQLSTEHILQLTYQPLSVFRVRPVTRCTDTLPGHTEAVLHVSYSPNGRHLASGGGDTTVRFWDVHTSLPKFKPGTAHKDHVLSTAWSPDGTRFASVDKRGILILWDPTTGESIGAPIKAHKQFITSLAWEPMHANELCDRLVTASKDGTAKVWNVRTRQHLATLSGHTDSIECVKWGEFIYTASRDRTIKVWKAEPNATPGKLVRTLIGHGHRINTLALNSDYINRTGPYDMNLPESKPWFNLKEHEINEPAQRKKMYELAQHRFQQFRATTCPEETLVSGSDDYTLCVWHPATSKHPLKRMTGHQNLINHIQFSPDGRFVASASFDKKVKVWNGVSGEFLCTLTGHVGAVYQVAWSADARWLVSASKDSTAKLWSMPTGKRAKETLPGHADEVYSLDWSPNGASVATGSKDRTIKIWKH